MAIFWPGPAPVFFAVFQHFAAGRGGRRDAAPSSVCDRALGVLRDDAHQAYAVAPPAHLAATTGPVTP